MEDTVHAQTEELETLELAAEQTSQPEEIQRKADQPQTADPVKSSIVWILPYLAVAAIAGAGILLLEWKPGLVAISTAVKLERYLLGVLGAVGMLALARGLEVFVIGRVRNPVSRFNLKRVLRIVVVLALLFIVISVLFVNWYAAVVSLGLISLVLGFALQSPISSFVGWIYILIRAPYRVGDRIEIGEARGDVIDVSYLDTTLWEIGGRHLSTDHPSGRLIKFPNTNVFSTPVINYSWPLFPYIWNEIKFHIAYESDLEFVASTMREIAEAELGDAMQEKVRIYRELLGRTPVNHLEVRERPAVLFRVSENTWLEAIVQYLVHPKEAGRLKTALTRKLLAALNAAPDRVLFPKSNMR